MRTTLSTDPDVRPGQVWADNDKRSAGRHVKVVHVDVIFERVTVESCDPNGVVHRNAAGKTRQTKIRLSRFRPTSTGYRLVHAVDPSITEKE